MPIRLSLKPCKSITKSRFPWRGRRIHPRNVLPSSPWIDTSVSWNRGAARSARHVGDQNPEEPDDPDATLPPPRIGRRLRTTGRSRAQEQSRTEKLFVAASVGELRGTKPCGSMVSATKECKVRQPNLRVGKNSLVRL